MEVKAIYEFPVPIWMTCATLGRAYQSGYGVLRFEVVMPPDVSPVGAPPDVVGAADAVAGAAEQVVWTQEYGAFIAESLRPATAVHRVAMTVGEAPSYPDKAWFTPDSQLADSVDAWFDDVRTWAEILTGQDLDPRHRVYDAESVGEGLTFIEPPHQGARGLRITTPRVRPLRDEEWAAILKFVSEGTEPPLEEVLSRDARAAQRRGANRRAVLDAATAVEVALGRCVRGLLATLPEKQQKRISDRTALGDYISIAEDSHLVLEVSTDRLRQLNKYRNDAAHRGQAPSDWETADAVQVMIDFLGAHGLYRRTATADPDGSGFVVSEREDEQHPPHVE